MGNGCMEIMLLLKSQLSVSGGSGRLMGTLAAAGWAWSLHDKQT